MFNERKSIQPGSPPLPGSPWGPGGPGTGTPPSPPVIATSDSTVSPLFEFSPDWDGLERMAVFRAGGESWSVALGEDGPRAIPSRLAGGRVYYTMTHRVLSNLDDSRRLRQGAVLFRLQDHQPHVVLIQPRHNQASVVGDVHDDQWAGMYLYDIFGRPLWEDVEVPAVTTEMPDPEDPERTVRSCGPR